MNSSRQPASESATEQVPQTDGPGDKAGRRGHKHNKRPDLNPLGNRNRGQSGRGERGPSTNVSRRPIDITNHPNPPIPPPPGLGGGGSFGARLTEGASPTKGENRENEEDLCFICTSPVRYTAISPCNHTTCHICALRLRVLYKTKACAHCRAEAEYVIISNTPSKIFEDFSNAAFARQDPKIGIKCEAEVIYEDILLLLRYNCPDRECDIACLSWPDLYRHVKTVHHLVLCDLCVRNKKAFAHEHELFTQAELRKHEKFGDDNPGAIDQSGFKGHPECGFCRQRFYSDDELYTHCRDKHERCHICDRRDFGRKPQYYLDYNTLEAHFKSDHFVCLDPECLEKKFVVFASEMDLKAHQLKIHPNDMSKDARRDARRIDMSNFDYRQISTRPRRENFDTRGGRGRGRDPNTEAIPPSTAQPLRRDELAYQRQMEIQSAQSVSTRSFGGQLSSIEAPLPRIPQPQEATHQPATSNAFPSLPSDQKISTTRQDAARMLRHSAVIDRASGLLQNDASKITSFRNIVSSFRTSSLPAPKMIEDFFTLFDVSATQLGPLIKELAEIYESEKKRTEILTAWNDWRAVHDNYPSLPGTGFAVGPTATSRASRVLKLKSSTAPSSRAAAVSNPVGWSNSTTNSIPPIGSANRNSPGRAGLTPWTPAPALHELAAPASQRAASVPPAVRSSLHADEAFPALPLASKPGSPNFGFGNVSLRRGDAGRQGGAWGTGGTATSNEEDKEGQGSKRKGNKGKKQMLIQWG